MNILRVIGMSCIFISVYLWLKALIEYEGDNMNDNRCICCGEIIPEGRQVCHACEMEAEGDYRTGVKAQYAHARIIANKLSNEIGNTMKSYWEL